MPPSNDNFADATVISGAWVVSIGSNVGATVESGEPNPSWGGGDNSVWWVWTAPATGAVTIDTFGSRVGAHPAMTLDTVFSVYTGTAVGGLTRVAYNDDDYSGWDADNNTMTWGTTSRVVFEAFAGTTYHMQVIGADPTQTGEVHLNLSQPPSYELLSPPDGPTIGAGHHWSTAGYSEGVTITTTLVGGLRITQPTDPDAPGTGAPWPPSYLSTASWVLATVWPWATPDVYGPPIIPLPVETTQVAFDFLIEGDSFPSPHGVQRSIWFRNAVGDIITGGASATDTTTPLDGTPHRMSLVCYVPPTAVNINISVNLTSNYGVDLGVGYSATLSDVHLYGDAAPPTPPPTFPTIMIGGLWLGPGTGVN